MSFRLIRANIPEYKSEQLELPRANFVQYKPDIKKIQSYRHEFGSFKKILVLGHGGSVTTFLGLSKALLADKHIKILSTVDPVSIIRIQESMSRSETLVIVISKSGETVTLLEMLMSFTHYQMLFITKPESTLGLIAKEFNARVIPHPDLGGRFTGITEVSLIPAAIAGIDVAQMYAGAHHFYKQYEDTENIAWQAAEIMHVLENLGYVDVFLPFYSHQLFAFHRLIIQLCHESFGKSSKGQTYFAHEAPESQHHTNQRFFGGRRNVTGFFQYLDEFQKDSETHVPAAIQKLPLRTGTIGELNKIPRSYAMHAEYAGTFEDAKIHSIPVLSLAVPKIDAHTIGEYVAFWQLYAVYSALLRKVNPFDQPQVETSKMLSWKERLQYFKK